MSAKSLVKSKNKYHHGDLRDQLLEAVRELVEQHGPDGFSIADACRLAGVSTAAPYKHFNDRYDILRGVVLLAMGRMRSAMQAAADAYPPRDPRRIETLGKAYVDFAKAEPGMFRTMFGLTESHGDDPDLTQAGDETLAIVERIAAEHLGLPFDHPEAKLRAYVLWCFVHGHSFLCLDSKLPSEMSNINEGMLLTLIGGAILPVEK